MATPQTYQSDTFAANGNGATMSPKGTKHQVTVYFGTGVTFGSGTLTLMVSPDGGTTWISTGNTITSATASTKVAATFTVNGTMFRWTLTGSTTPTLAIATKLEQQHYREVRTIAFAADGSSDTFTMQYDESNIGFTAMGTWGSGSLTLQCSPDGGTTWFKVGTAVTANGYQRVTDLSDTMFKFVLSGSTTPSLTVKFFH
jgi:hypothetical protein